MVERELPPPRLLFVHRLGEIRGAIHCKATVIDSRHLYEFLDWQGGAAWLVRGVPQRCHVGFVGCETTDDYRFLAQFPVYATAPWQEGRSCAERRCLDALAGTTSLTINGMSCAGPLPFFLCCTEPWPAYVATLIIRLRVSALIEIPDVRAALTFDKVSDMDMDDALGGAATGLLEYEEAARRLRIPLGCPVPIAVRGGCAALEGVLRLDEALGADQYRATIIFMDFSSGALRLCHGDALERRVAVPRFIARSDDYFRNADVLNATIADILEVLEMTPLENLVGW